MGGRQQAMLVPGMEFTGLLPGLLLRRPTWEALLQGCFEQEQPAEERRRSLQPRPVGGRALLVPLPAPMRRRFKRALPMA